MASIDQYRFTLRIHPLIMEKMKYIAETNGRSVNKEIEQILKWVISDYENKRGRIVRRNRTTCAASPSVRLFLNLNEKEQSFPLVN